MKASAAFGQMTLKSIEEVDPTNPGVQPRPTIGIQFVDIPEFQDLGTKVSQDIAAAPRSSPPWSSRSSSPRSRSC
jgi:sorbitol/mannitol transport system substrate-binding protein